MSHLQVYYFVNNNILIQNDGVAIAAPSSSILSEVSSQHAENSHFAYLAQKHRIINYFLYVDDILLIFYPNHTDIQAILTDFNSVHPKLHFIAEIDQNNTLNSLDVSIHKTQNNIKTSIYRKPTFAETVIPYTSNHPIQQKYAAIKFLYNRLKKRHTSYTTKNTTRKINLKMAHN